MCSRRTVVLVCMLNLTSGGDAASFTMKCTAPSVLSGLAVIQSSASDRVAKPNTCRATHTPHRRTDAVCHVYAYMHTGGHNPGLTPAMFCSINKKGKEKNRNAAAEFTPGVASMGP